MKKSQLNAIYYAQRQRKIDKIKAMGLYEDYLKFKGESRYNKIATYCRKNNITL